MSRPPCRGGRDGGGVAARPEGFQDISTSASMKPQEDFL